MAQQLLSWWRCGNVHRPICEHLIWSLLAFVCQNLSSGLGIFLSLVEQNHWEKSLVSVRDKARRIKKCIKIQQAETFLMNPLDH